MIAALIDTLPSALKAKRTIRQLRQNLPAGYGFVELDSCYIRYREMGKGEHTLVLAIDPPVTLECYDELLTLLAEDYRVFIFELPGFGYSMMKHGFDFGFDATVETLQQLLKHWDAGPYSLAFPCASAYFSIALANRYPDMVSHLAMIQAPCWQQEQAWKHRLDPHRILNRAIVGQLFIKAKKRQVARQWVNFASGTKKFAHAATPLIDHQLRRGGCYCLASAMQYCLPTTSPTLSHIEQPATLVYGVKDKSHGGTDFTSIREYGDHITLAPIDIAGHFPELEKPAVFKAIIDQLHQLENHNVERKASNMSLI